MAGRAVGKRKKLRIGWFTFTCCEGCATVFVELMNDHFKEWREQIDFRHCRILKSKNDMRGMDLAIVEGAIASKDDVDKLKTIRRNAKRVMIVGSCAINGMPAALRNNFDAKKMKEIQPILRKFGHLPKVEPVVKFIKVDSQVPGCPMSDKMFLAELGGYLAEFGVKSAPGE
ncbi:Sulfhydrogenase 1 subunit delta [uncultured archaeon]|nr:Sulfhydrogenase 1 subunit delta [uncultured archaeon]